jgi:hypothetical protein
VVIGYEESSQVEVEPAKYFVLVTKRETRRLTISVRDYFSAIPPGLADFPIRCLPDLTRAVWVARHS